MYSKAMNLVAVVAAMALCGTVEAAPKKASRTTTELSGVININTATEQELRQLPGIGPSAASAIVAHRAKTPFRAAHEIVKVKGIGDKTFKKLKAYLAVSGPTTLVATKVKLPAAGEATSNASQEPQSTEGLN